MIVTHKLNVRPPHSQYSTLNITFLLQNSRLSLLPCCPWNRASLTTVLYTVCVLCAHHPHGLAAPAWWNLSCIMNVVQSATWPWSCQRASTMLSVCLSVYSISAWNFLKTSAMLLSFCPSVALIPSSLFLIQKSDLPQCLLYTLNPH